MAAARVVDLLDHLAARGIQAWLDGGWCIDALLETQTRTHDDLDLVCLLSDADKIESALGEFGYICAGGGAPLSFELVDPEGHQVDTHPVSLTPSGDGLYRMANGEDWIYPAQGFTGVGQINGRKVPCISTEVMLFCHTTGYALDLDHQHDVVALSERFGIPLPEFRRAETQVAADA